MIVMPPSPTQFATLQQQQQQQHNSSSQQFDLQAYLQPSLNDHHHQQQQQQQRTNFRPSSSRLHPNYHRLWLEQQDHQEQYRRHLLVQRPEDHLRDHFRMNIIDRSDYNQNNNNNNTGTSNIHMACVSIGPSSSSNSLNKYKFILFIFKLLF